MNCTEVELTSDRTVKSLKIGKGRTLRWRRQVSSVEIISYLKSIIQSSDYINSVQLVSYFKWIISVKIVSGPSLLMDSIKLQDYVLTSSWF